MYKILSFYILFNLYTPKEYGMKIDSCVTQKFPIITQQRIDANANTRRIIATTSSTQRINLNAQLEL